MKVPLSRSAVAAILLLGSITRSEGQGGQPLLPTCAGYGSLTVTDATCDPSIHTDCVQQPFTAPSCNYCLYVELTCTGNCDPSHCLAFARVTNADGSPVTVWIHTTNTNCSGSLCGFSLIAYQPYILWVCLNAADGVNCDNCTSEGCVAKATLKVAS